MNTKKIIQFHKSSILHDEIKEVVDTLKSGWITTGPKTKRFEEDFRKYIGCKYAIGLNSCTAGLHLALAALNIGEGDEVITTPITFPATANVIIHQKATPVFVDVKIDTLNIDVSKIEEKITSRTKAIMPVHFAGHPCDMGKIMDIAMRNKLSVIEDAAHAIESEYNGKKVGNIGDFTSFSFYATKNITTGEGGMLTTNNDELAEKARMLSLHGISKDAWKRYGKEGFQHWELFYPGFKYNMFDIQAAIGIHQLKKIESFLKIRKKYVDMYNEAFEDVPEILPLKIKGRIKHAHHLYVIIIKTEELNADRDEIMSEIQNNGVGLGVHFRTLHLQPYYQNPNPKSKIRNHRLYKRGMFPVAEYASDRVISLPLYPKMSVLDVKYVIKVVKEVIEGFRK
ncbi:MAG: DegT/DnrJ/EryC1/StrS family aminotransferase [Nitrospinae bacterium]|nr:DegT/DnrJ/EryC1/StrS family aminotransferase [Nitrospinota bacterium]